MNILVIGGTRFIGRHFVQAALREGHELTLFHRGQTNPGLFADIEEIFGDRGDDIDKLAGRWDVVVDTCGYVPRDVRRSARHLHTRADRYLFISTVAVYRDLDVRGLTEDAYLKTLEYPDIDEVNASTYGPLKTECEAMVTGEFNHRCLIVRPGVVAGPHDPTDRFTYWACRVDAGQEVLAPGYPSTDIQVIDVRDLAQWLVHCIQAGTTGVYNATGPTQSFEAMLQACRRATDSDATFTWVPNDFLHEMELDERSKMPLWNRNARGRKAGLYAIDSSRARGAGLTHRPMEHTASATLQWLERQSQHRWSAGLNRLEEREILDVWHGRRSSSRP